jgi:hypothetical protein
MVRFALYSGRTIAEAVTDTDRILVKHDLLTGFATLFVGLYDQNERTLTYVNCGQEPGLIWRAATGDVDALPPTGPVLGGFESAAGYTKATTKLLPGDVLVLFTDGMTEVGPSRTELLEIEGLTELFRRCCVKETDSRSGAMPAIRGGSARSSSEIAISLRDALVAGVEAYAGGTGGTVGRRDDVALLVGVVEEASKVATSLLQEDSQDDKG